MRTNLGSNSMTSGREKFSDTCGLEPGLSETECGSQASTTGTSETDVSERAKCDREASTHTTTASYSCSMRGYLPDDHDFKISEGVNGRKEENGTDEKEYLDFLGFDWVGRDNLCHGRGGVE